MISGVKIVEWYPAGTLHVSQGWDKLAFTVPTTPTPSIQTMLQTPPPLMKHLLIILISILVCGCHSDKSKTSNPDKTNKAAQALTADTTGYSLHCLEDLHERLTLKDYDQGLADYIRSNPNRPDSVRKVVYLLPFGNMKPEIEQLIRAEVAYLKAFLQLDVQVLDRMPYDSIRRMAAVKTRLVPNDDFAYYSKMKGGTPALTEQIQAAAFMDAVMKPNKPADAVAVLGITEHDIYNPAYNYLFGVSQLQSGVGVVSTFRLIDYGPETKNNIRKTVSKQIVNMFSIPNVKEYKCVMNFHIDIEALYQGKFDLSPRALEKLKYAAGFDYAKRFTDLAKFWKKENNQAEVAYHEACAQRILLSFATEDDVAKTSR